MKTLDDVLKIDLKTFNDEKGSLVPIESDGLMNIKRIFYVYNTPEGETRGKHSHRKTNQLLITMGGSVEVVCDDGNEKKTFILDSPSVGLFIPFGIWADEKYLTGNDILMVLCDTKYSHNDYVFNYQEFLDSKK